MGNAWPCTVTSMTVVLFNKALNKVIVPVPKALVLLVYHAPTCKLAMPNPKFFFFKKKTLALAVVLAASVYRCWLASGLQFLAM